MIPCSRRREPNKAASTLAALVLLLFWAAPTPAAKRNYSYEEDPVRLGMKALEENRTSDARAKFDEAIANEYQAYKANYGLAEVAVREGRYLDAEPLYRIALEGRMAETKSADFPEAHAGLGLLLLRFGRDAEAKKEFEQALKEKAGLWEALYGEARLDIKNGKFDDAKRTLGKGSGRKGLKDGEDKYHFGMALALQGKGDLPAAEKEALTALNLNPAEPEYGTLVAQIYDKRNAPTLAIDAYVTALNTPGMVPTAPVLRDLGVLYEKTQQYNEALDRYKQAIEIDSLYAPALKEMAELYALGKQYDKAAKVYLRYVQLQRDDTDALVGLAEACIKVKLYAQALEASKTAYAADSTRLDVRQALARAGLQSRDKAEQARAATLFESLPDSAEWEAQDYISLGSYQVANKQFVQAEGTLARALEADSTQADTYFQLGMLDLNTAKADSAAAHFQTAIRLNGQNALYYLNLGIANFQARKVREAIRPFRDALGLNDQLVVGRVLLAQALAYSDSLQAAEVEYKKVLEVEPTNAKALRGLGFCYIRKAAYSDAYKAYKDATAAEPGNADGWAGLGNACLGLQKWQEAEEAFKKALELDPNNSTGKKGTDLLRQARKAAGN